MAKYKLKEFITQLRGVSYKPTDVTDKNNGTPVLRANNIQDEGLIYDDLVYLKPDKIKENQKLIAGDIVICASSGSKSLVGKASIFTQNSKVMSFGAFCKAVRVKDIEGINKDFIRLFFSSSIPAFIDFSFLKSKGVPSTDIYPCAEFFWFTGVILSAKIRTFVS